MQALTEGLMNALYRTPVVPIVVKAVPDKLDAVMQAIDAAGLDITTRRLQAAFAPMPLPPLVPLPPLLPFLPPLPPPPAPPLPPPPPFALLKMPLFGMLGMVGTVREVKGIAGIAGVERVYLDLPVWTSPVQQGGPQEAAAGPARREVAVPITVGGDEANAVMEIPKARELGLTGRGVKVAVIDTGVLPAHQQFFGEFVGSEAVLPFGPVDENGHGTHVATTIKGRAMVAPSGKMAEGVAPGAQMLAIKVLGFGLGFGTTAMVLKGMERAVQWGAHIVNMSLGSEGIKDAETPFAPIVEATAGKILWCIAAGNSGPGAGTTNTPGTVRSAITVGSWGLVDSAVAHFSSRGPTKDEFVKPDVVAPGGGRRSRELADEKILSGVPPGSVLDGPEEGPSWNPMQGTSMATPRVAGLLALVAEAAGGVPSTEQVVNVFRGKGRAKNNEQGYGLVKFGWFAGK